MGVLHLDFESRSTVNLKKCGLHVYAVAPTTDIICAAFAFDDESVQIWFPSDGPIPHRLYVHIFHQLPVWGHNISFEFHLWNEIMAKRYNAHPLVIDQCFCTMAGSYAMGLPGSLDHASAALGIKEGKDMKGHRLMMKMCQPKEVLPNGAIVWHEDSDDLKRLGEYCKQDVVVERAIHKRILSLSPSERQVWLMDQEINNRGIALDLPSIKAAQKIVAQEQERLNIEMREVTGNEVSTYNANGQLKDFLVWRGFDVEGVAAPIVKELLERKDLDYEVRRALEIRQEAAKSSVAKLTMMDNGAMADGRIRGLFQYHAAATGRWGGRRIQPQNFPRNKISQDEIEEVFILLDGKPIETQTALDAISMFYGPPMSVISDCLRGFLVAAPGHELIGVDFSQIEARILPWLAGQEVITDNLYEHAAAGIYRIPVGEVTKQKRQIGKIAILSLGYGGGKVAFTGMAKQHGLDISEDEAETIKIAWREKNPKIVDYWADLEEAAIQAVLNPGHPIFAGAEGRQVVFKKKGSFLWCKLPSGRVLCYPYPQVAPAKTPWGEMRDALTYMSEDTYTKKWTRQKTYGGSLAENCTQAVARCVLVHALKEMASMKMKVVLHCHDELVIEMPIECNITTGLIEELVTRIPKWAKDLPIAAEAWKGKRYQK